MNSMRTSLPDHPLLTWLGSLFSESNRDPRIAALYEAVKLFVQQYPDTPPVTIVIREDEMWGLCGYTDGTWCEIVISESCVRLGAEQVVSTLLHELAHARNAYQGIRDVDGQYHNLAFKARAEEQGLTCMPDLHMGWSTRLSPEGRRRWAGMIAAVQGKVLVRCPACQRRNRVVPGHTHRCGACRAQWRV
jgi:hypothetical protein